MSLGPGRIQNRVWNILITIAAAVIAAISFMQLNRPVVPGTPKIPSPDDIVSGSFRPDKMRTEPEWKSILTAEQYRIMRQAGTEIPFTGKLNGEKRKGKYYSPGCGIPLFGSDQKYDSGTGWPSFRAPASGDAVVLRREGAGGRIEVLDPCGNHLGHVFDDGPEPTGKRFCINSAALEFVPEK